MPKPSAADNEKNSKKKIGGIRAALFGLGALAATSAAEASELPGKNTSDMTATEQFMSKAFPGIARMEPLKQMAPNGGASPEMPKVEVTPRAYELHTLTPAAETSVRELSSEEGAHAREMAPVQMRDLGAAENVELRKPQEVEMRGLGKIEPVELMKLTEVEAATPKPLDVAPSPLRDH